MKRTNPKGDDDPGWVRITWDEALDTIVAQMQNIKQRHGPEAFFFQKGSTGGSSGSEWYPFFNRLANIYGSPNFGGTGHICCYTRSCPGGQVNCDRPYPLTHRGQSGHLGCPQARHGPGAFSGHAPYDYPGGSIRC